MAKVGYDKENQYLPWGIRVLSPKQVSQGSEIKARTLEPESLNLNPDLASGFTYSVDLKVASISLVGLMKIK